LGIFGKLADYVAGAKNTIESGRGIAAAHRAGSLNVASEEIKREYDKDLDKLANQLLHAWVPYSQTISSQISQADVDDFLKAYFDIRGFNVKGATLQPNPKGQIDNISLLNYFKVASAERTQIPPGEVGSARGVNPENEDPPVSHLAPPQAIPEVPTSSCPMPPGPESSAPDRHNP
jgi:hypothetical protein